MFTTMERRRMFKTAVKQMLDDSSERGGEVLDRILADVMASGVKHETTEEDGICASCMDLDSQPVRRQHGSVCDNCNQPWHVCHKSALRRM